MVAQQKSIDMISNNIANINTIGYKKEKASFKDNLYTVMERRPRDVNLQVGSGSRVGATQRYFHQGAPESTGRSLDVAIYGPGFIKAQGRGDDVVYTRDGSLQLSSETDQLGSVFRLTTSSGYYVLDEQTGNPISFRPYYPQQNITFSQENVLISEEGDVSILDEYQNAYQIGKISVVSFANPEGLESIGDNIYKAPEINDSIAGEEIADYESKLMQGYIERSNVDLGKEMIELIMSQRAYQLSARVLQSADEMERLANDLRN